MTKTELISLVQEETGRTDKDTLIGTYLDMGLKEIGMRHTFKEMVTEEDLSIVADDEYVSLTGLSNTYHEIFEVRVIDGTMSKPFRIKRKSWVVSRWPNISAHSSGKPTLGYIEGSRLYLYPVSDDQYDLRITYSYLPTFSSDLDETPIPIVETALVSLVKSKLWTALEQYEKAGLEKGEFEHEIRDAIRADQKTHEEMVSETKHTKVDVYGATPWYDPFVKDC